MEQWIIPPFFEDYLFDKSFGWESIPCSAGPPYTTCGETNDLLTMDLELNHIPRLGTYIEEILLLPLMWSSNFTYLFPKARDVSVEEC